MEKFLLFKYLKFDKNQPFITVTAVLAFLGIGIGVMVLLVAMAIMNGMSREFKDKLSTMNYPLTIYPTSVERLNEQNLESLEKAFPRLVFSPYIRAQVVLKNKNLLKASLLFGVDFAKEIEANATINEALKSNNVNVDKISTYSILLGRGIKQELFLNDRVRAYFMQLNPVGLDLAPTIKNFKIIGDFSSGLIAYDNTYSFTTLAALRNILGRDDSSFDGIHIYSDDPMNDKKLIVKEISKLVPQGANVVGWWESNGSFFSAMELEKRALFVVLMLIILMAALNIISSTLMLIMQRRKEIALLTALGANKKEIFNIFFFLGVVIGICGIVFGVGLAFLALYLLDTFPIISLPEDIYGISKLPLYLSAQDFCFTIVGAISITILSSYYPALRASKLDPLKTLRSE